MADTIYDLGWNQFLERKRASDAIFNDVTEPISPTESATISGINYSQTNLNVWQPGESMQSSNFVSGLTGWKINGDGKAEFVGLTLTGGVLKYQKSSFTDNTVSGYYVGPEGIYMGSAGDATLFRFIISTGLIEHKAKLIALAGSEINGAYLTPYTVSNSARTISYDVNLIPNKYADFEQFGNGANIGVVANGTATCDTSQYYFGTRCLKMVATAAGDNYVYFGLSTTDYNIPLLPNTKYIISVYAKGNVGGENIECFIRQNNGTHRLASPSYNITTSWARYTFTVTTTSDISAGILRLDNNTGSATIWYDGIKVERASNAATPEPSEWSQGALTEIYGQRITANSITADKISVTSLSAISANLGTITSGNITIDASGFIRGGASGYKIGDGWWLGYDAGAYKFYVGSASNNKYFAFNGTDIEGINVNQINTFTYGETINVNDALFLSDGTEKSNVISNDNAQFTCLFSEIAGTWKAQTFTTSANTTKILGVVLWIGRPRDGSDWHENGSITVSIRATSSGVPTGSDLATAVIPWSDLGIMYTEGNPPYTTYVSSCVPVYFDPPCSVSGNTMYAIVVRPSAGTSWYPGWVYGDNTYSGGTRCYSTNNGATWTQDASHDYGFRVLEGRFTAGRVYKAFGGQFENISKFIGFAKESGNAGDVKKVQIEGTVEGFTGLESGKEYYLSNTAGVISTASGTYTKRVGIALSSTRLKINPKESATQFPNTFIMYCNMPQYHVSKLDLSYVIGRRKANVILLLYSGNPGTVVLMPGDVNAVYLTGDISNAKSYTICSLGAPTVPSYYVGVTTDANGAIRWYSPTYPNFSCSARIVSFSNI
jgi:hypothetical protein